MSGSQDSAVLKALDEAYDAMRCVVFGGRFLESYTNRHASPPIDGVSASYELSVCHIIVSRCRTEARKASSSSHSIEHPMLLHFW